MSSLNKCSIILLLLLSACGFHPLYGTAGKEEANPALAGIKVDPLPGRAGQELKAALEDMMNPDGAIPANPAYRLHATLATTESAIGTSRDGTVSRYNVYLDSNYTVYRIADNKAVLSGSLRQVSSYNNAINAYFSTYVSEQDASRRGVAELAQLYRDRLAAWLDAGAPEQNATAIPTAPPPPANAYPVLNPLQQQGGPWGTAPTPGFR